MRPAPPRRDSSPEAKADRPWNPYWYSPVPRQSALGQALGLASYSWKAVSSLAEAEETEPDDGWSGGVICADEQPDAAFALCRALRKRDVPFSPLLLVLSAQQLGALELREDLFDDFCATPCDPRELEARLSHLFWRTGRGLRPELVEYGPLVLNLETYQASVAGRPLSLTFMEYELLKFLATHPGKVFTRETLLSRVWGYEYYGGARTVDVHIRRLRAKLGEEHANVISTVRSVGYRFGQSRWAL